LFSLCYTLVFFSKGCWVLVSHKHFKKVDFHFSSSLGENWRHQVKREFSFKLYHTKPNISSLYSLNKFPLIKRDLAQSQREKRKEKRRSKYCTCLLVGSFRTNW
jgi:hypothetical protein